MRGPVRAGICVDRRSLPAAAIFLLVFCASQTWAQEPVQTPPPESSQTPAQDAVQQSGQPGKRDPQLKACDQLFDHGRRLESAACYRQLLDTPGDPAVRAEAAWGMRDLQQANGLFRAAVQARPEAPHLRVRWGYLYLETHNTAGATKLFEEALALDKDFAPAKLGIASVDARGFDGKTGALVREVIEADPDLIDAYLLLARMAMEEDDLEEAATLLDQGLDKARDLGQSPLDFYALKASIDLLRNQPESEWTQRALDYNPTYGGIYSIPAHFYVITRRYREAVALLRKAVETDPRLWSAHAELSVNLLRLGDETEGRHHLEIAYAGDRFDPKTVNSLRLLDSFERDFRTFSSKDDLVLDSAEQLEASLDQPEVVLKLHQKEAEVLRPYVMRLAQESIEIFSKKYRFQPRQRIRVELFPDHEDFAVRTMSLPGVGLLGVTFGYVVAMDSPSARTPGSFHWGTTLWHEMAHVFTLEATNHLVPRWYSEGISMYEEWQARPGWGERPSTNFLKAMQEKKLLPVAELDRGFVRPKYPGQIIVSYFQAGLTCRMIAEQWEFEKLVDLLYGYAQGRSTADNIQEVLGITSEEFDERFQTFVTDELGERVRALPEWRKTMKTAIEASNKKEWDAAIEAAAKGRDLFPEFVAKGTPYLVLGRAYDETGERGKAIEALLQYQKRGGKSPRSIKKLAGWLDEAGRRPEAIEALEGLLYIGPGDDELHTRLGGWLLEENRNAEALREFKTHLAMKPLDIAGAHFNVARAYHNMKALAETQEHVLLALEAAPNYRPAQKLLLEIID